MFAAVHILIFGVILTTLSIATLHTLTPASGAASDLDCVDKILHNATIPAEGNNTHNSSSRHASQAQNLCSSIIDGISFTRTSLNNTRIASEEGNITNALAKLNTTIQVLQKVENAPFDPSTADSCRVDKELQIISIPLSETRIALEEGNITNALANLSIADEELKQLQQIVEASGRISQAPASPDKDNNNG